MKRIVYLSFMVALLCSACMGSKQMAKHHARQGKMLFEARDYKRAVKHFEAAEKTGHIDGKLLYLMGSAYFYLERFDEAIERFEKAAKVEPENPEVWFMLGNAYYNIENFEGAARGYRKAVESKANFLEAIEALAMIHPDGGVSREEACLLWQKALELETRDEWIIRAKHYIGTLGCEGAD